MGTQINNEPKILEVPKGVSGFPGRNPNGSAENFSRSLRRRVVTVPYFVDDRIASRLGLPRTERANLLR